MTRTEPRRVVAYIDGYNMYYGMREKRWQRYMWLDYRRLIASALRQSDQIIDVKYFTARVTKPEASRTRQANYLRALAENGGLTIIEGTYSSRRLRCPGCDDRFEIPEEKRPTSTSPYTWSSMRATTSMTWRFC